MSNNPAEVRLISDGEQRMCHNPVGQSPADVYKTDLKRPMEREPPRQDIMRCSIETAKLVQNVVVSQGKMIEPSTFGNNAIQGCIRSSAKANEVDVTFKDNGQEKFVQPNEIAVATAGSKFYARHEAGGGGYSEIHIRSDGNEQQTWTEYAKTCVIS